MQLDGKMTERATTAAPGPDRAVRSRKSGHTRVLPDGVDAASSAFQSCCTAFERLDYDGTTDTSLVRVRLHSGRRHQIRAHLAIAGHPIANDSLYGGKRSVLPPPAVLDCTALASPDSSAALAQ